MYWQDFSIEHQRSKFFPGLGASAGQQGLQLIKRSALMVRGTFSVNLKENNCLLRVKKFPDPGRAIFVNPLRALRVNGYVRTKSGGDISGCQ
jgi:hypothetical protein